MQIAVFGLGYVGMTTAACLASQGHEIVGIDPSEEKTRKVMAGMSPITEPQLNDMIKEATENGRLRATTSPDGTIASCELAIVCVGTPSAPDGSHNMSYIAEVTKQIARIVRENQGSRLTVVYRSTIRPGTIENLIDPIIAEILEKDIDRIELVYNPEFLRESVAVADFYAPPKIVVGTRTGERCSKLEKLNKGIDTPIFNVKFREAEIIKFVDNSYHALKTTFANEIGRICTKLGISARTVHEIFVSDTKLNISKYYLRPGGAFGGSCLPKDVRALQYISRQVGGATHTIDSLISSNEAHKQFLFETCTADLNYGEKVLMLGIAFKDKSDDLRESPNIDIARSFITAGYSLSIFDPYVKTANLIGQNLGALTNSPFIRKLLVTEEQMNSETYDLVVDTRSIASDYPLKAKRIIDINQLA